MTDRLKIEKQIENIAADANSGFLLIAKPTGEPSFHTISQLRKITKQKKIGFAGTLDPAASGLLVIGCNQATKLLDLWHQFPKEYLAEITLGQVSTTYDREGIISEVRSKEFEVRREDIDLALKKFIGPIQQIPPMYSAKSVGGQRLYELARAGQEIERQPSTVTIYSSSPVSYTYPVLNLKVVCSSGTYIRSLAHDLGQVLGVGAYLSALERTAIGPYTVSQAQRLAELSPEDWQRGFINLQQWQEYMELLG